MKSFKIKPIINKRNGQINFYLPKQKLSKTFLKNTHSIKSVKIKIEEWEI